MDQLSSAEVLDFLKKNCEDLDEESIKKIKDSGVNGKRAARWSLKEWTDMGLPYGDVVDIVGAVEELKNGSLSYKGQKHQGQGVSPCNLSIEHVDDDGMTGTNEENLIEANDDELNDKYASVACYFTDSEFKELSTLEKDQYVGRKQRYESAIAKNVPLPMPEFMKRKIQPRANNVTSGNGQVNRPSTNDAAAAGPSRAAQGSLNPAVLSNTLKRVKTTKNKKAPIKTRISDEELAASLPKFNIEEILQKKMVSKEKNTARPQLKAMKEKLAKDGIVYGTDRKLLMRTLTNFLYYDHVNDVKLLTMDMKEGMAVSITEQYPLFLEQHPTKRPWFRILDRQGPSGFIANCSVSILRSMDSASRPRGGGKSKRDEMSQDEDSEEEEDEDDLAVAGSSRRHEDKDASWMSLTMPTAQNKASLLTGMKSSFACRRNWINCAEPSPSATEILTKYPHLMSYGGEILAQEFELIHPHKSHTFTRNFPIFVDKIVSCKELPALEDENIPQAESDLVRACLYVASNLRPSNISRYRRARRTGVEEDGTPDLQALVHIIPLGCNVETVVRQKREEQKRPVQPYLLALVPQEQLNKLYLVLDSKFIELHQNSLVCGLDFLFKAFTVFNVDYPLGWKCFWELVEHGLLDINSHLMSSHIKEFYQPLGLNFKSSAQP